MVSLRKLVSSLLLCLLVVVTGCYGVAASDDLESKSATYGISEVQFGSGGVLCDLANGSGKSANYCASSALGETASGNSKSNSYQIQAGGNETDRQPFIEFDVTNTNIDVGVLNSSSTKVATATFSVKTYLAGGYVVQTVSPPPQNGGYSLHALSTPTSPSIGNEQFGMNLVANACPSNAPTSGQGSCTTPTTLGADRQQLPDSTFGFGYPTTNYGQANKFMYKQGDIVAKSDSSSGTTLFTISYIFNTTNVTPGGTYTMNQVLVATSTF